MSTKNQVKCTIEKYFNDEKELFILKFQTSTLGEPLKWERSRNSNFFPHFYGVLEYKDVIKIIESPFHEF